MVADDDLQKRLFLGKQPSLNEQAFLKIARRDAGRIQLLDFFQNAFNKVFADVFQQGDFRRRRAQITVLIQVADDLPPDADFLLGEGRELHLPHQVFGQRRALRQHVFQRRSLRVLPVIGDADRSVVFQIVVPVEFLAAVAFAGQFSRAFEGLRILLFDGVDIFLDIVMYLFGSGFVCRHFFQKRIFLHLLIDRFHEFLAR